MSHHNVEFQLHQHREHVGLRIREIGAVDIFNVLTSPGLLAATESCLLDRSERLYPPMVTFVGVHDASVERGRLVPAAADAWAIRRAVKGLSAQSINSSGYCQARQRLPVEMVRALTRETGRRLCTRAQMG